MHVLTLALLLVSVILCFSKANPVIGRHVELVNAHEFPFVVSVQQRLHSELLHFCGGALITRKHVLTAEHCLWNMELWTIRNLAKADEIFVKIGNIEYEKGVLYNVVSYITFVQWAHMYHIQEPSNVNDLAILTLAQEVNQPGVTPGHIAQEPSSYFIGKFVTLVGWGRAPNLDGSQDHLLEDVTIPYDLVKRSSHLRKGSVKVLSPEECRIRIKSLTGEWTVPVRTRICTTAEPPVVVSKADCGGPLIYGNEIIGINDFIVRAKGVNSLRVWHRDVLNSAVGLEHYREFINSVVSHGSSGSRSPRVNH